MLIHCIYFIFVACAKQTLVFARGILIKHNKRTENNYIHSCHAHLESAKP